MSETNVVSEPPQPPKSSGVWVIAIVLGLALVGWFLRGMCNDESAKRTTPPESEESPQPANEVPAQYAQPELVIPDEVEDTSVTDSKKQKPAQKKLRNCFGSLEPSQIQSVVNTAAVGQVRACYERRLKENNLLQGSMNVELVIHESGRVENAVVSGSLNDSRVFSCVKRTAKKWSFPSPKGGCVRTSIPFTMTPRP